MGELNNENGRDVSNPGNTPDRRKFLGFIPFFVGILAIGATVVISIGEILLSPLRKKKGEESDGGYIFVTKIDSLSASDSPKKFKVFKRTLDAWTRYESKSVGSVYLKKIEKEDGMKVLAWNARCPHGGCPVGFREKQDDFFCGCHNSRFTNTGQLPKEKTYSPRPMDTLKVEIRNDEEVWIEFINFQVGTSLKKPVS